MAHTHKFAVRMRTLLKDFNLEEAEKLSQEIHEAEAADYWVCVIEDALWDKLTEKIQSHYCKICKRKLDQPDIPDTKNCGGDCLRCMAEAGDPDCIKSMKEEQCTSPVSLVTESDQQEK